MNLKSELEASLDQLKLKKIEFEKNKPEYLKQAETAEVLIQAELDKLRDLGFFVIKSKAIQAAHATIVVPVLTLDGVKYKWQLEQVTGEIVDKGYRDTLDEIWTDLVSIWTQLLQ